MPNYGRDLDIGRQEITELKDVIDKLAEVEKKVEDTTNAVDETVLELRKVSLGTGLVTGVDLDEEVG